MVEEKEVFQSIEKLAAYFYSVFILILWQASMSPWAGDPGRGGGNQRQCQKPKDAFLRLCIK